MSSYIPVDPSKIQSELDKLEETYKQNNQLRASLFNLIVYTHKGNQLPYFISLVDLIIQQFPCRIIFIEEDTEKKEPFLEASIAAKLIEGSESLGVLCDKIYLKTSKDNTEQIHHLILQHALIDLPTYLLWGQDPTLTHPLFPMLKQMAKRLIFHSECSDSLQLFSQKMLSEIINDQWEVADLNWISLEEWREVIKATFSSKEAFSDLSKIKEITLKFCGSESPFFGHNHFQVHYLHAWLAAQLKLEFVSFQDQENEKKVIYKKNSSQVEVKILQEKCGLKAKPGTVMFFQVKTENKKIFTFSTDSEEDMIHIEIVDEENPSAPYNTSLIKSKWALYLAKEICYNETSAQYVKALQMISKINGLV